jgi:hypothetical protein
MTIDVITITFFDGVETCEASFSNLNGNEYPDFLENNEYAKQVFDLVRKALEIQDSNSDAIIPSPW